MSRSQILRAEQVRVADHRSHQTPWRQLRQVWLVPVFALSSLTALVLFGVFLIDWYSNRPPHLADLGPLDLLFHYDLETLQNALGNLTQTVVAVLGIVTTVVAIVVQLAATRYTPRVTELFFREKTNFVVFGFFTVTCVLALWVSLAVGNGFVPRVSVAAAVILVTASLLLMFPYFIYVFDFLDPEKIVIRIQVKAFNATEKLRPERIEQAQELMLTSIEQLADIALTATSQQDKIISCRAVDALRVLAVRYTRAKSDLPLDWFDVGGQLNENPDFQSLSAEAVRDLVLKQRWVEWTVLRKYQTIYNEALGTNPDMNYLIGINTRSLGEVALDSESMAIGLVVKFFNTYLRATINRGEVRTAYNVLHQYRLLVEAAIRAGKEKLVPEIASYFRYYGQVAHAQGLGFVTETTAYDLATLCEAAHRARMPCYAQLLDELLELDKEAETEAQETTLRGVRKAQARLATYFLIAKDEDSARKIYVDMEQERPGRLASIRDELVAVRSKDFWEVIDRGANFDYMSERRRAKLHEFFGWFENVDPHTPGAETSRVAAPGGST
ncbi:MAG: DUF2254 domain-containing protein [Planctomycetes bacterium]|nr:DUF2254 domain-containing protein [Planctomycetota bacterium]